MKWLRTLLAPKGRGPEDWMTTASGLQYFPFNPRAEDVRIYDIAHHLSRINRYTGAARVEHYSVAEHSWHVSFVGPPEFAFERLMHDTPEAYTNDLSRPFKRHLPDYKRAEERNWRVIADVFGLPYQLDPSTKWADMAVLRAEQRAIMPPLPAYCPVSSVGPVADVTIHGWSPNVARARFLARYDELTRGVGAVRPWPGRPRVDAFYIPEPTCA